MRVYKNVLGMISAVLLIAALLIPTSSMAGEGYYKYVRIGGGPGSPYITYAVYWCYTVGGFPAPEVCEFRYTMIGMNPDL